MRNVENYNYRVHQGMFSICLHRRKCRSHSAESRLPALSLTAASLPPGLHLCSIYVRHPSQWLSVDWNHPYTIDHVSSGGCVCFIVCAMICAPTLKVKSFHVCLCFRYISLLLFRSCNSLGFRPPLSDLFCPSLMTFQPYSLSES